MNRKLIKFVLFIPALAGLFLLASIPNFSTNTKGENFWYMTEDEITVDKSLHDFGTIKEERGEVSATFILTNNTKKTIVLTQVTTSCGCTTPEWTKSPIEPGKTGKVIAIFDPKNRKGFFNKSINITISGYQERITVGIKGLVE